MRNRTTFPRTSWTPAAPSEGWFSIAGIDDGLALLELIIDLMKAHLDCLLDTPDLVLTGDNLDDIAITLTAVHSDTGSSYMMPLSSNYHHHYHHHHNYHHHHHHHYHHHHHHHLSLEWVIATAAARHPTAALTRRTCSILPSPLPEHSQCMDSSIATATIIAMPPRAALMVIVNLCWCVLVGSRGMDDGLVGRWVVW